eukprot:787719-Amphidinium_carterae.1
MLYNSLPFQNARVVNREEGHWRSAAANSTACPLGDWRVSDASNRCSSLGSRQNGCQTLAR